MAHMLAGTFEQGAGIMQARGVKKAQVQVICRGAVDKCQVRVPVVKGQLVPLDSDKHRQGLLFDGQFFKK